MKYLKHLDNIERIRGSYPKPGVIRLGSAERDIPFATELFNRYIESLCDTDIRFYPDIDYATGLLSKHANVPANNLVLGHGSDSIIKNVFECFVSEWSEVVTTDPCFPMYNIYAQIRNADIKAVPYKGKRVDVENLITQINEKTSLVIFSNPSSPIGDLLYSDEINDIIEKANHCNCIVLIDEAYGDYGSIASMVRNYHKHKNVIVTKTFSKAVGSAGLRFGYGVSNEKIITILSKVKNMYEITGPTIKWMETIIENWGEVENYMQQCRTNSYKLSEKLQEQGYEVEHSYCPWIHTTKLYDDESISTKQCKLPWDDRMWTRLCIPADKTTMELLLK